MQSHSNSTDYWSYNWHRQPFYIGVSNIFCVGKELRCKVSKPILSLKSRLLQIRYPYIGLSHTILLLATSLITMQTYFVTWNTNLSKEVIFVLQFIHIIWKSIIIPPKCLLQFRPSPRRVFHQARTLCYIKPICCKYIVIIIHGSKFPVFIWFWYTHGTYISNIELIVALRKDLEH